MDIASIVIVIVLAGFAFVLIAIGARCVIIANRRDSELVDIEKRWRTYLTSTPTEELMTAAAALQREAEEWFSIGEKPPSWKRWEFEEIRNELISRGLPPMRFGLTPRSE